jgi:hypothetical protein
MTSKDRRYLIRIANLLLSGRISVEVAHALVAPVTIKHQIKRRIVEWS